MELKGDLQNFALPDVIQLLCMSKSTGKLTFGGKPEGPSIYFREGEIIHAAEGLAQGEEAAYQLFSRANGSFEFFAGAEPPRQTINQAWMNLILEAARRADEQKADISQALDGFFAKLGQPEIHSRDMTQVKLELKKILESAFGGKSKKIQQKIDETEGTETELLALCDKIEKFIQVFIDRAGAKRVVDRMRDVILGISGG